MEPVERVLDALRGLGLNPRRAGEGWSCRCPAHEDREPSLSINEGSGGRALIKCHAGCALDAILERLRLAEKDLFPEPAQPRHEISEEYDYTDERGKLLYQVVRMIPKTFRQRAPDGMGGWIWSLKGVKRVLYRLPEVLDAISLGDTIYVVEGEKDVHSVELAGKTATTNAGGSGKWDESYTRVLANASYVIIIADNDEPGLAHARAIQSGLNGTRNSVMRARQGKDVTDHLAAGFTLEELVEIGAGETPAPTPPPAAETADAEHTDEKVAPSVQMRVARSYGAERVHWLPDFEGFIPKRMVTLCAGLPGLGKSMLLAYIAANESRQGRIVALAAAEDSIEHILIPRLVACGADLDRVHFIAYVDEHGDGALHMPDHGSMLRDAVLELKPDVLGIDPIGSFMGRGVDAWKATDVRAALGPFKTIAEEGNLAAILVAHLNKGQGDYLQRISDSAAFGQFVRSGLLFARDPDDPDGDTGKMRVLASGKSNVGAQPRARRYRIEPRWIPAPDGQPPDISTAGLTYAGESRHDTLELLAMRDPPSPETRECAELLTEMLRNGPVQVKEIEQAVRELGHSMTPMRKAAERLAIKRTRLGYQKGATWELP